ERTGGLLADAPCEPLGSLRVGVTLIEGDLAERKSGGRAARVVSVFAAKREKRLLCTIGSARQARRIAQHQKLGRGGHLAPALESVRVGRSERLAKVAFLGEIAPPTGRGLSRDGFARASPDGRRWLGLGLVENLRLAAVDALRG